MKEEGVASALFSFARILISLAILYAASMVSGIVHAQAPAEVSIGTDSRVAVPIGSLELGTVVRLNSELNGYIQAMYEAYANQGVTFKTHQLDIQQGAFVPRPAVQVIKPPVEPEAEPIDTTDP